MTSSEGGGWETVCKKSGRSDARKHSFGLVDAMEDTNM